MHVRILEDFHNREDVLIGNPRALGVVDGGDVGGAGILARELRPLLDIVKDPAVVGVCVEVVVENIVVLVDEDGDNHVGVEQVGLHHLRLHGLHAGVVVAEGIRIVGRQDLAHLGVDNVDGAQLLRAFDAPVQIHVDLRGEVQHGFLVFGIHLLERQVRGENSKNRGGQGDDQDRQNEYLHAVGAILEKSHGEKATFPCFLQDREEFDAKRTRACGTKACLPAGKREGKEGAWPPGNGSRERRRFPRPSPEYLLL